MTQSELFPASDRVASSPALERARGREVRADWQARTDAPLVPRNAAELVRLIQSARREGEQLSVRSRVPGAQAAPGPLSVDLSGWAHVDAPAADGSTVTAEPGASLRQVLAKTLPLGLLPVACPSDLESSLGGILSGAGLGSAGHHDGFLCSRVAYAQVVLGTGEVVHVGQDIGRDVWNAVFGGAGRFGIITAVDLGLAPAPACVRTFSLSYESARHLVADLLTLAGAREARHVTATLADTSSGGALDFVLHVSSYPDSSLFERGPNGQGLGGRGLLVDVRDRSTEAFFASQHEERHASARVSEPAAAECRFAALLPRTPALPMVLEQAFECARQIGRPVVELWRNPGAPAAVALPDTRLGVCFSIDPVLEAPSQSEWAASILEGLQRRLYRSGGRLVSTSWVARPDPAFWQAHYGASHARLARLKRRFDPMNLLCSRAGRVC